MGTPAITVRLGGGKEFQKLGRDLKKVGSDGLKRRIYGRLQDVGKKVIEDIKLNAIETLPEHGGLSERVIDSDITLKVFGLAKGNPRLHFQAQDKAGKSIDLPTLDRGTLKHPLFGNRHHWYRQRVTPGWFTKPITDSEPEFRKAIQSAMDDFIADIEKG